MPSVAITDSTTAPRRRADTGVVPVVRRLTQARSAQVCPGPQRARGGGDPREAWHRRKTGTAARRCAGSTRFLCCLR